MRPQYRVILLLALAIGLLSLITSIPREFGKKPVGTSIAQAAKQPTIYRGNVKSRKFHRPGCRYYRCKNCLRIFKSRDEAIKAGYIPCKVCRP